MWMDPAIAPQLRAFGLDSLESTADVVLATWADGRVAYVNAAWDHFATLNGAPSLAGDGPMGRNVFDVIAPELQAYYRSGWESVLATREVWRHRYECSSPSQFREYLMLSYPLLGPEPALLHVHSLVVAGPHDHPSMEPVEARYRNLDGIIVQCANCRRVRFVGEADRWDWVPEWVETIPDLPSHGVCGVCLEHYYR